MAAFVYIMCSLTAFVCSVLLFRGYLRSRTPLMLGSALCFLFLSMENVLLFVDRIIYPAVDLSAQRAPVALLAMACLLYGAIWKDA